MGIAKRLFGSRDNSSEDQTTTASDKKDETNGWGPANTHEDGSAMDEEGR